MSRLDSLKIKAKLLQKAKKKSGKPIQLKEAYEIIAKSGGYESWRAMKSEVEEHANLRPSGTALPYWNNWYSSYDEAKGFLKGEQEFLLPFEDQFFICGPDYISALGIDSNDPDLSSVGNDWVHPKDPQAHARLMKKIETCSEKKKP